METINHECYVSLEVAKLLKEVGFDWKCNGVFLSEDGTQYAFIKADAACDNNNSKYNPYNISAPTIEVAQRWLRVVKGIYIGITAIENKRAVTNSDGWTFHYEYGKPTFDCDIQDERCENMCTLYDSFDTYEEALEVGIKKALEIIL